MTQWSRLETELRNRTDQIKGPINSQNYEFIYKVAVETLKQTRHIQWKRMIKLYIIYAHKK